LTQVLVDKDDPAFKKPSKPIGPHLDTNDGKYPMIQVASTKKWRKVVPSPAPKRIMELGAIKALINAGFVVVCCGGGGIPVVTNGKNIVGIEAVIDKDWTSSLLAVELNADVLIMLTDIDGLKKNFGTPQQESVSLLDINNLSASDSKFLAELEGGSMGPKVLAGVDFAKKTSGWAAIGALNDLEQIFAGTKGTRIQKGAVLKVEAGHVLPDKLDTWTEADVIWYLTNHLRLREPTVKHLLKAGYNNGAKLKNLKDEFLQGMGLSWMTSSHVIEEIEKAHLGHKRIFVESQPYRWPYNRDLQPHNTALVIIDMQRDFLEVGGYISEMGYSLENGRSIIPNLQILLKECRRRGFHIIHTREGHRPSLSDCPSNKHWRSLNNSSFGIGDSGPLGRILVKGEPGWDIIKELEPDFSKEIVIDKPGKGSFVATDLELVLNVNKIQNLIITGVTTDVCVHTTLREANDRGYECLLLSDCSAALDKEVHNAACKSVQLSGGIFGAVADLRTLLDAFTYLDDETYSKRKA